MKVLDVSYEAYEMYREIVEDADKDDYDMVRRKLTRNMALSLQKPRDDGESVYCIYGSLHFIVVKGREVVWIKNGYNPRNWKKDRRKYVELNRVLGINVDKTVEDVVEEDNYHATRRKLRRLRKGVSDITKDNGYINANDMDMKYTKKKNWRK